MKVTGLFKQHNLRWIGPFIDVLYLTSPMFGMVSYGMMAVTMYTVIQPFIREYFPWLNIGLFFTILVFACLLMLLLVYKFIYPSYFTFRNKQEYMHNNLIREDLEKIKKRLGIEN